MENDLGFVWHRRGSEKRAELLVNVPESAVVEEQGFVNLAPHGFTAKLTLEPPLVPTANCGLWTMNFPRLGFTILSRHDSVLSCSFPPLRSFRCLLFKPRKG